MAKKLIERPTGILHESEINIRFNEVDSIEIVWHGHYISYFEQGREAFGKEHDFGYMICKRAGYVVPIVQIHCDYKQKLEYEDEVFIQTEFVDSPAAKLIFNYRIYKNKERVLVATGKSVQVFVDMKGELCYTAPAFFKEWKASLLKKKS